METAKSESLFARAVEVIPGGVNSPVRAYGSVGMNPQQTVRMCLMRMAINISTTSVPGDR